MKLFTAILGNNGLDTQLLTVVEKKGGTLADVQQMLFNGANPNAPDYRRNVSRGYEGQTALHYASIWPRPGRGELVKVLLKAALWARSSCFALSSAYISPSGMACSPF